MLRLLTFEFMLKVSRIWMTSHIFHRTLHCKEHSDHTCIFKALMYIFQRYQYSKPDTNLTWRFRTSVYKMLRWLNYKVFYNNRATNLIWEYLLTCPAIHHLQYHLLLSSCSLSSIFQGPYSLQMNCSHLQNAHYTTTWI